MYAAGVKGCLANVGGRRIGNHAVLLFGGLHENLLAVNEELKR